MIGRQTISDMHAACGNMHPAREIDIGESRDRVHVCIFLFLKSPQAHFITTNVSQTYFVSKNTVRVAGVLKKITVFRKNTGN